VPLGPKNIQDHGFLAMDDLSDCRNNIFGYIQGPETIALAVDGTVALDGSAGNSFFIVALAANATTVDWANGAYVGQVMTLELQQDATGSRTFAWPDTIAYTGGEPPTISTGASLTDVFQFIWDGTIWQQLNAGSIGNVAGS